VDLGRGPPTHSHPEPCWGVWQWECLPGLKGGAVLVRFQSGSGVLCLIGWHYMGANLGVDACQVFRTVSSRWTYSGALWRWPYEQVCVVFNVANSPSWWPLAVPHCCEPPCHDLVPESIVHLSASFSRARPMN
jgi:hypothetical protein